MLCKLGIVRQNVPDDLGGRGDAGSSDDQPAAATHAGDARDVGTSRAVVCVGKTEEEEEDLGWATEGGNKTQRQDENAASM